MCSRCLKQSGKSQNRNKRELTCKKGFPQHSSNQESPTNLRQHPLEKNPYLPVPVNQLLGQEPYTLLLTGVKALQLLEEQGKKDSQVLLKDTVIQKNGTLVSSGCHRKIPQTGWLKVQKFIFSQFGKLDISDRGCQHRQFLLASMCSPSHCVLTRWKKQASSLVSLISTLILSDQVPTLMT